MCQKGLRWYNVGMTLVICLDKNNGYQFGGKRQSADREVRGRILKLADVIRCDEYTALSLMKQTGEDSMSGTTT